MYASTVESVRAVIAERSSTLWSLALAQQPRFACQFERTLSAGGTDGHPLTGLEKVMLDDGIVNLRLKNVEEAFLQPRAKRVDE